MDIKVTIDLDRDGTFSHPLADISDRVIDALSFTSGWTNVGQVESNVAAHVSPVNALQLVLDNSDGQLSFENPTALFYDKLYTGIMVRVTVTYAALSYTFTYFAQQLIEAPGQYGEQTVLLNCVCAMPRVQRAHYEPLVTQNVTTSAALTTMIESAVLPLPYTSSYFMIDHSQIDGTDVLYDIATHVPLISNFETGLTTMDYVGDIIHESRTGIDQQMMQLFVADMCMAEAFGRFFYQPRDGKLHFHNRFHDKSTATSLTVTGADYVQANSVTTPVYNEVRLHYTPRKVGTPAAVIFSSDSVPLEMRTGEEKTIRVKYRDPDDFSRPAAALDVIDPVAGTDIIITDSSSNDVTLNVFDGTDLRGAGGTVYFNNTTDGTVTIDTFQVRGTAVTAYDEQIAIDKDPASMYKYNWTPLPDIRSNYITNDSLALGITGFAVLRHKDMRRVFESVMFVITDDNFADIMPLTIGDVVQIEESWSNHDSEYVILGEYHQYNIATGLYNLTWYLRSNSTTPYFVIDTSVIDGPDLISY